MTEHIKVRADSQDEEEMGDYFPPFLWLLRDFSLELVKDGKPITEKEYMEYSIALRQGASKQIQARNNVLRSLRTFFKDRY